MSDCLIELVRLSRWMGEPERDLVVLAEGNTSCREGSAMWVKASGCSLAGCDGGSFVRLETARVAQLLDSAPSSDVEVREVLNRTRIDNVQAVPSTEAFMHAVLLGLPGVSFVAHAHPTPLLPVLALEEAGEYAARRLFPDEIVFCGPASVYVPYVAPGLPLALAIRANVADYQLQWGEPPRTIWLQNHGLICLGQKVKELQATLTMAVKAAHVLLGALSTGHSLRWMSPEEIAAIQKWPDEAYRRRLLSELSA